MAGGFLKLHHAIANMVEDADAHVEAALIGQIVIVVTEVSDHLVHAVHADR